MLVLMRCVRCPTETEIGPGDVTFPMPDHPSCPNCGAVMMPVTARR